MQRSSSARASCSGQLAKSFARAPLPTVTALLTAPRMVPKGTEKSSSVDVHGLGWALTMQGGGSGAKKCSAGMQGVLLLRGREEQRNT